MELNGENVRQFDRRKHARVVKDVFAVYATDHPYHEGLLTTQNVSGAGILFRSADPFRIGVLMNLNIQLPDRINPIPCEARVVRSIASAESTSSYEIGLAFTRMMDADKKELVGSLLTQDDRYLFL